MLDFVRPNSIIAPRHSFKRERSAKDPLEFPSLAQDMGNYFTTPEVIKSSVATAPLYNGKILFLPDNRNGKSDGDRTGEGLKCMRPDGDVPCDKLKRFATFCTIFSCIEKNYVLLGEMLAKREF